MTQEEFDQRLTTLEALIRYDREQLQLLGDKSKQLLEDAKKLEARVAELRRG